MFPRSVSVSGALEVRSAHTRPTGMCRAYWSVSRGPKACELRLFQVLCTRAGTRAGEVQTPRVTRRRPFQFKFAYSLQYEAATGRDLFKVSLHCFVMFQILFPKGFKLPPLLR